MTNLEKETDDFAQCLTEYMNALGLLFLGVLDSGYCITGFIQRRKESPEIRIEVAGHTLTATLPEDMRESTDISTIASCLCSMVLNEIKPHLKRQVYLKCYRESEAGDYQLVGFVIHPKGRD